MADYYNPFSSPYDTGPQDSTASPAFPDVQQTAPVDAEALARQKALEQILYGPPPSQAATPTAVPFGSLTSGDKFATALSALGDLLNARENYQNRNSFNRRVQPVGYTPQLVNQIIQERQAATAEKNKQALAADELKRQLAGRQLSQLDREQARRQDIADRRAEAIANDQRDQANRIAADEARRKGEYADWVNKESMGLVDPSADLATKELYISQAAKDQKQRDLNFKNQEMELRQSEIARNKAEAAAAGQEKPDVAAHKELIKQQELGLKSVNSSIVQTGVSELPQALDSLDTEQNPKVAMQKLNTLAARYRNLVEAQMDVNALNPENRQLALHFYDKYITGPLSKKMTEIQSKMATNVDTNAANATTPMYPGNPDFHGLPRTGILTANTANK
jgi:hypothetical protein